MHTLRVAHSQAAHNTASNVTTGVSWTPIVLQNGWVSSNATFASGNPKVALQGNIVYLSGSLHQSSGSSPVFGFLPSTFRPTHNMWITIYTYGGTSGTLFIAQDGTMELFSGSSCSGTRSAMHRWRRFPTRSTPNHLIRLAPETQTARHATRRAGPSPSGRPDAGRLTPGPAARPPPW
jgi:hypothetical protein